MAQQFRGTATFSAKTPRRLVRRRPLGFWPVVVGVVVVAGSSNPERLPDPDVIPPGIGPIVSRSPAVVLLSPSDGEVLERQSVEVTGKIESEEQRFAERIKVDVTGRQFELPINENRFGAKFTDLSPGWNQFKVRLGSEKSKRVEVLAPRIAYHFDDSTDGWTALSQGEVAPVVHSLTESDSNGFLCAENFEMPIDIVFVIDTTDSMLAVHDSVIAIASRILDSIRNRFRGSRFGIVTFHDRKGPLPGEAPKVAEVIRDLDGGGFDFLAALPKEVFNGGGDPEEDQYLGISEAIKLFKTANSPARAQRAIIVLSDAPPTQDNDDSFLQNLRTDATVYSVVAHFRKPLPKEVFDVLSPLLEAKAFKNLDILQSIKKTQEAAEKIDESAARSTLSEIRQHEKNYERALAKADELTALTCGKRFTVENGFLVDKPNIKPVVNGIVNDIVSTVNANLHHLRISWLMPKDAVADMRTGNATGDRISFSIKNSSSAELVLISHDKSKMRYNVYPKAGTWNHFEVDLFKEENWTLERRFENSPSNLKQFLAQLESIRISADQLNKDENVGIDRFIVTPELSKTAN